MVAERITVGVYALDAVLLPKQAGSRGWAARLAEAAPVLRDASAPSLLSLAEGADGWKLAEDARLGETLLRAGRTVAVEPVEGRNALFLIRVDSKAMALSSAVDWPKGTAHLALSPSAPEGLAAYALGTLIDTPDGPRPVESLVAGDAVTTLANGSRPLRWVGRRRIEVVEMLAHPGLRPVEFAPGTMGNDRTLRVSPRQRMLIDDWRAAVYFGEDRVLVSAQALVDDQSVRMVVPAGGMDYVMLLCDRHEVLLAEGALSESFHPGEAGLDLLSEAQRAEVIAIFPEADLQRRRAAFPIVRTAEARALRLSGPA
ncbi:MAG: Hint domain-containing protein [Tabrizicola sp.]